MTCFEALEHVIEHDQLIAEVLRVLNARGRLADVDPGPGCLLARGARGDPFHTHEVTENELVALLSAGFSQVRVWGQNVAVGSVIAPFWPEHGSGEVLTLGREQRAGRRG